MNVPRVFALALAFVGDFGELGELGAVAELEPFGLAWACGFAMDFARTCPSA